MDQKYKRSQEFRTPLSLRDIGKNPRSVHARVPQAMGQFVLKIEKLSHIMGPTPMLEMAGAYGFRPRLWFLVDHDLEKSSSLFVGLVLPRPVRNKSFLNDNVTEMSLLS